MPYEKGTRLCKVVMGSRREGVVSWRRKERRARRRVVKMMIYYFANTKGPRKPDGSRERCWPNADHERMAWEHVMAMWCYKRSE